MSYRDLIFPPADTPPTAPVPESLCDTLPGYAETAPPVFVGHYWLPVHSPFAPMKPNIACLDYSAAKDGPLVAYRWDGEREISAEKFIS
jgi:hypothetical protein